MPDASGGKENSACFLPDDAAPLSLANLTKASLFHRRVGSLSARLLDLIHTFCVFVGKPKS